MSAYIIANVHVTDAAQYEEYKRLSTIAINAYGAQVCVRGGEVTVLEGDWQPDRLVILKFTSVERAKAFYDAPEGTAARPIVPDSSSTSHSTVGLPRLSRISRPTMSTMALIQSSFRFFSTTARVILAVS